MSNIIIENCANYIYEPIGAMNNDLTLNIDKIPDENIIKSKIINYTKINTKYYNFFIESIPIQVKKKILDKLPYDIYTIIDSYITCVKTPIIKKIRYYWYSQFKRILNIMSDDIRYLDIDIADFIYRGHKINQLRKNINNIFLKFDVKF